MLKEQLLQIGDETASIWGGSCHGYEIDQKAEEVLFFCKEHGEEFVTSVSFGEIKTQHGVDLLCLLCEGECSMDELVLTPVIGIAKSLGWSVTKIDDEWEFRKGSPAGQDFSVSVAANTLAELQDELRKRHTDFDCSAEAYRWLDDDGHGANGAPYDMKALYEDMEACQEMLLELVNTMEEVA